MRLHGQSRNLASGWELACPKLFRQLGVSFSRHFPLTAAAVITRGQLLDSSLTGPLGPELDTA